MFNFNPTKPLLTLADLKLEGLSDTERVIYWTIVLTPVWWLLGIQPIFYPGVIAFLLITNFDLHKLFNLSLPACAWTWLAMALLMLWTALLGINEMGFSFQVTAAAIITFFKSYFLIFACLAIPFWNQVRLWVITRAVAWMTTGYIIVLLIEMALLVLGIGNRAILPPFARLIPGDKGSLMIILASVQRFFGIPLPRTVLYTPDPPILGICAVLCFFICLGEKNRRLRQLALAGCWCALIVSFSRIAWVCLPIALIISGLFSKHLVRQFSLWTASVTFLISGILGLTFGQLLSKPIETFNQARAESSSERAIVVQKTLEAWQEKPLLGWGVIRGAAWLYDDVYIGLGSFSTYAAVLYLNGIVGFIFFVIALLATLLSFYAPAIRGNLFAQRAFACLLVLYVQCNATPLSWMAVYLWFFFLWLGGILKEAEEEPVAVSSWEDLAAKKQW